MATCVFTPTSGLSTTLRDILTDRPAVSKYHNFLRGFQMHNEYIQHEHFTKWKGVDGSFLHVSLGQAQGMGISKGHLHVLKRTEWVLWSLRGGRMKELTPFTVSNTNVQLFTCWVLKVLTGIKIARVGLL